MKMLLLLIGIGIGFMIVPIWMKVKNKQVKFIDRPLYTPQQLTEDEKEYPIRDSYGNKFKTMPTVYSKDLYLSGKSFIKWRCPSDCWASIQQLWIDDKYTGNMVIHLNSYNPFYPPPTISYMENTYNGLPDTPKQKPQIK